jgi:aspartate/methionine/tyrosine aminotransferase
METDFYLLLKKSVGLGDKEAINMNPIAQELNQSIQAGNSHIFDMLSSIGKNLFFPKGILSQSAEAKEKAHRINATIGIATEKGRTMHFPSVMSCIQGIEPEASLTYAPSFGLPALRKAWQKAMRAKNPSIEKADISLPVVACGITHAISVFADLWVDPGDVILFPEMMWGNYNMILSVRKGATIQNYNLFADEGGFDISAFKTAVAQAASTHQKIIVMLNFPQNPSGYTVTKNEASQIVQILTDTAAAGTNVIAVSDDAYFGLFYEEDTLKESIFSLLHQKDPRLLAIKLDGATKENFVWGLRIGFVTYGAKVEGDAASFYEALEKKTAGGVRGSISNASHLSQSIVLRSMEDSNYSNEQKEKFEILNARAKRVKEVLQDSKYTKAFEPYPFNSGYFMCLRLKTVDAEPLRQHLLNQYGVGLIALGDRNLRVAFSCLEESDVTELFDTILKGVVELEADKT